MNAAKRPVWRFDYLDLTNPASCIQFLVELVKSTWTGEIGTRQAGCMNNSIRTMLSYYLNAKMPQSQSMAEIQMPRRETNWEEGFKNPDGTKKTTAETTQTDDGTVTKSFSVEVPTNPDGTPKSAKQILDELWRRDAEKQQQ